MSSTDPRTEWDRQGPDELPPAVIHWLHRQPGEVVAIIASVDADGAPRTAPFGALRAVSPTCLRFSCRRTHATYANICRDGRVMVALYGPPDIALGIGGRAWVVQERLRALPDNAVIQIDVEAVKDDLLPWTPIASGITYTVSNEVGARLEALSGELEAARPDE